MNIIYYDNLFSKNGKIFFPKVGSIIPVGTIIQSNQEFKVSKVPYVCVKVLDQGYDHNSYVTALKPLNAEEDV